MDQSSTSFVATLRAALEAARASLDPAGLGDALARMTGPELADVMALADEVRARAGAAQVRITAEAAHRGEFGAARRGAGSVHAWVREHAPSLRQAGAGQVAALAQDVAGSVPGGLWSTQGPDAGAYADPSRPEGVVWARVATGEVGPALALTALREVARMKELLVPEAVPTVTTAILDHGVQWGAAEAKKIRTSLLAAHGRPGELDDQARRLRSGAYLSSPQVADGDGTEYRMAMTPEQATTLEAAIGPLSRPAPDDETGERDLRPAGQRRVEALAAVCARAIGSDAADSAPGAASTTVHVAMDLDDLRAAGGDASTGSGRVMVSRAEQTILAPATVLGSRATPTSSRSCSAPRARSSTSAGPSGSSPDPSAEPCGTVTQAAPSRGVTCRRRGPRRITSCTGPTAEHPTSTTPPSSASATTPSSTTDD